MRILFSLTNLDLGGAQMFVMRLAEELSNQGHEVYIYNHYPEWSNKDFQSSFTNNVRVLCYSKNSIIIFITWKISGLLSRFNKDYSFRKKLSEWIYKRSLKKYKIEIINSQMYASDKINSKIAVKYGIPFVITTHGEYELNFNEHKPEFEIEARSSLSSADAVIYTAEKNIDAIRTLLPSNKPARQIIVGFDGDAIKRYDVDPSKLGIEKGDFVIGMVARGIPEKGWNEAIEMFHLLKKSYTKRKLHLILIGNGDDLKQLFEKKKTDGIHLLQFSVNPMQYFSWLAYFDIGILFSYFRGESVPNAIIEYLYYGLPVLATSIGDIKKMISSENGLAGGLVPFKDGKADFSAAADIIKKWLDDPDLFNQLKNNTKSAFVKFSMKTIAGQYLEVYNQVVADFRK